MTANTKIEWADHTFNPWIGCTRVSPACDNCYAAVNTASRSLNVKWGPGELRHRTSARNWQEPHKWDKQAAAARVRARVFCASLADVFDNEVPAQWRHDLMCLIQHTPHLDWLLLTKRPQNIVRMVMDHGAIAGNGTRYLSANVWLGTTAEDQKRADMNIPSVIRAKLTLGVKVAFVSMEPLLGPVDLNYVRARISGARSGLTKAICYPTGEPWVDWVIVGGESGPGARPMHPEWVRNLRDQCDAASVRFLFKQWGEWVPWEQLLATTSNLMAKAQKHVFDDGTETERFGKSRAGRLLDGVIHDAFPEVAC